ncbi:MAG: hypothetical protein R3F55_09305 [Alphaproteobacteria bacterium]
MAVVNVSLRNGLRATALSLAALVSVAAISPAEAGVCTEFTLTEVVVAVFENGQWDHTAFEQTGPGTFAVARDPAWPATVTLLFRWDVNPGADPSILNAAALGPDAVYIDYQYVGDGFGVSFGVVAQINDVPIQVGQRLAYMETAIAAPALGCDVLRSDIATLAVTPWLRINPDRIPLLACQGPNCDLVFRRPGEAVSNPIPLQQLQPQLQLRQ